MNNDVIATIVILQWQDAAMHGDSTYYEGELENIKLASLISGGVLVKEDKESITLCQDYRPAKDGSGRSYRGIHIYPKTGIAKIIRYEVKSE